MQNLKKTCNKCKIEKTLNEFSPHKDYKDGVISQCKKCRVVIQTKLHNADREKYLERNKLSSIKFRETNRDKYKLSVKMSIYKKLGITITKDEYLDLYKQQEGKCKICNLAPTGHKKSLCLDHDHVTLKVRGLLCDNCNMALGKFKDSNELLQNAINYLNFNSMKK